VLQCVAVCCSVLYYVALCCSVLMWGTRGCVAGRRRPLQYVAVSCSVVQYVAAVLQQCCSSDAAVCCSRQHVMRGGTQVFVAVHCIVLQCVAVCCSAVQHVAVSCSVLQCVAVWARVDAWRGTGVRHTVW